MPQLGPQGHSWVSRVTAGSSGPQLGPQAHSWVSRAAAGSPGSQLGPQGHTAPASGKGMGALGHAEKKPLKCAGDKPGVRVNGQGQGQAGRTPSALRQGLHGGTRGPPALGKLLPGAAVPGQCSWHGDVAPRCPATLPSPWSRLAPGCTPALLQRRFLKRSQTVPGPAVPVAPGWHQDRDAGSVRHRGAGGRRGLLTQHRGCLSPRSWISKDLQVCLSHPIPAAGSGTRCHPGLPGTPPAPGKELAPEPQRRVCVTTVGEGHKDMRLEDVALQPPGRSCQPSLPARTCRAPSQRYCHIAAPAQLVNPPWPSQANALSSSAACRHPKGSPSTQPMSPSTQVRGARCPPFNMQKGRRDRGLRLPLSR